MWSAATTRARSSGRSISAGTRYDFPASSTSPPPLSAAIARAARLSPVVRRASASRPSPVPGTVSRYIAPPSATARMPLSRSTRTAAADAGALPATASTSASHADSTVPRGSSGGRRSWFWSAIIEG